MDEFNPYAPPKSAAGMGAKARPVATGELWWDGDALVVPKGAVLPDVCVKCGEDAVRHLRRKLSWHSPGYYLLLLINLLVYAIVALIVRKTAEVHVGLCERHVGRRRTAIIVGWVLALGSIAGMVVAVEVDQPALIVACPILLLIGALIGAFGARVVYPKRIDDRYVWLKGVRAPFPVGAAEPYAWPVEP
jgi:hypothetical protein